MFIDPPSPFAPLTEWESFLVEMKAIDEPTDDVLAAIANAERIIAEMKAGIYQPL